MYSYGQEYTARYVAVQCYVATSLGPRCAPSSGHHTRTTKMYGEALCNWSPSKTHSEIKALFVIENINTFGWYTNRDVSYKVLCISQCGSRFPVTTKGTYSPKERKYRICGVIAREYNMFVPNHCRRIARMNKESDVWLTVHRNSVWKGKPTKCHFWYSLFLFE